MNKKLKVTLATIFGLVFTSIIPLGIIDLIKPSNSVASYITNKQTQLSNEQTLAKLHNVEIISSPSSSLFAIARDDIKGDRIYGWGTNSYGELGFWGEAAAPRLIPTTFIKPGDRITNISSSGTQFSVMVINGKDVYTTGLYLNSALGDGTSDSRGEFTKISFTLEPDETIIDVVAAATCLVLTNKNNLYVWGDNYYGQIGDGTSTPSEILTPKLVPAFTSEKIEQIGSEKGTLFALANNELFMWGNGYNGQMGNGASQVTQRTPEKVNLPPGKITQVSTPGDLIMVVLDDNKLYGWGYNGIGILGGGDLDNASVQSTPYMMKSANNMKILYKSEQSLIVSYDNNVYAIGGNWTGQLGLGNQNDKTDFTLIENSAIDANNTQYLGYLNGVLALRDNKLYAWGSNAGAYGDGEDQHKFLTPTQVDPFGAIPSYTLNKNNETMRPQDAFDDFYQNNIIDFDALDKYVSYRDTYPIRTTFSLVRPFVPHPAIGTLIVELHPDWTYGEPDGYRRKTGDMEQIELFINNFIAPTKVEPKLGYNVNQSATEAYKYLSENPSLQKLEEYVNILHKPNNFTLIEPIVEGSIDNKTGTLKFSVKFENYYDDDGNITSLPNKPFTVELTGFMKDSSIKVKNDYSDVAISSSVLQLMNELTSTDSTKLEEILQNYFEIDFSIQSAPNVNPSITKVNIDDKITNLADGKMAFTLNLANYYENGERVTTSELFILEGFAKIKESTDQNNTITKNWWVWIILIGSVALLVGLLIAITKLHKKIITAKYFVE